MDSFMSLLLDRFEVQPYTLAQGRWHGLDAQKGLKDFNQSAIAELAQCVVTDRD